MSTGGIGAQWRPMAKYFFVAGEASGDHHSADVIRELFDLDPEAEVHGYGGPHMREAGATVHYPLAEFASVGLDWVGKIFQLRRAGLRIVELCKEHSIDMLVLVDFPGFNLRVATAAKKAGIRVVYYITPQVWGWKTGRVHRMRRDLVKALVILPFEEPFLQKYGVPAKFVGHPLVDRLKVVRSSQVLREEHGLPMEAPLVGLLPGSRKGEVDRLAPVLRETARLLLTDFPDLHFVVPRADSISTELLRSHFPTDIPITFVDNPSPDLRSCFRASITKSGTSTLENAILRVPQVIIYKGRWLDAWIAKRMIQVKWLGLVNLLADEEVCPEFLQEECIPENIAAAVRPLIGETPERKRMLEALGQIADSLGAGHAARRAAEEIRLAAAFDIP